MHVHDEGIPVNDTIIVFILVIVTFLIFVCTGGPRRRHPRGACIHRTLFEHGTLIVIKIKRSIVVISRGWFRTVIVVVTIMVVEK